MNSHHGIRTLGTLLRHLTELTDGEVEQLYVREGLNYRPRYTPIVRALIAGPLLIKDIAAQAGVSHSAVSQTVTQMKREGWVQSTNGSDARQRFISLTPYAQEMLPKLQSIWAATNAASVAIEAEMTVPLYQALEEAIAALERQSLQRRIAALVERDGTGSQTEDVRS